METRSPETPCVDSSASSAPPSPRNLIAGFPATPLHPGSLHGEHQPVFLSLFALELWHIGHSGDWNAVRRSSAAAHATAPPRRVLGSTVEPLSSPARSPSGLRMPRASPRAKPLSKPATGTPDWASPARRRRGKDFPATSAAAVAPFKPWPSDPRWTREIRSSFHQI